MSTIAARAHSPASISAPVRRGAAQPRRQSTWLRRILRMAAHRPGRTLVLMLFAGVSVAILANALMLQKARHPAPMVSAPSSQTPPARQASRAEQPAASTAPAPTAASVPLPPSRPNDLSQQAREAQPREAVARPPAAVTNVARTPAAPAPAPAARSAAAPRDPIADLINGADIRPPAEVRGVAQAKSSAPRRSADN